MLHGTQAEESDMKKLSLALFSLVLLF